mmetsp:Transcript_18546/g.34800  ORF Transcript_18546/g.34800 Transcript_18546/m.34800 type:complete len:121 (+) Transcript_18546:189-551(+)
MGAQQPMPLITGKSTVLLWKLLASSSGVLKVAAKTFARFPMQTRTAFLSARFCSAGSATKELRAHFDINSGQAQLTPKMRMDPGMAAMAASWNRARLGLSSCAGALTKALKAVISSTQSM